MHPPLPVLTADDDAGVDGIHGSGFIRLHHTSFLFPRPFGRSRLRHADIRGLAAEGRHAIIEPVDSVIATRGMLVTGARDDIRRPNVCRPLPFGVGAYPLYRFAGNLRECPSHELPIDQVFGTAHLDISQGDARRFGLFAILTEDGIGGIHIIIIAQLAARRVVHVVRAPRAIVSHRGQRGVIIRPRIGRIHRNESRDRPTACRQGQDGKDDPK